MLHPRSVWVAVLGVALAGGASLGGCGAGKTSSGGNGAGTSTMSSTGGSGGSGLTGLGGSFLGDAGNPVLDVEPSAQKTIMVTAGQTMPTITYNATLGGVAVPVTWSVDRGNAATITSGNVSTATFAPTGTAGGLVNVIASRNGTTVQRAVFIQLTVPMQNGPNSSPGEAAQQVPADGGVGDLTQGGGVGGVGGEGLGPPVTSFPTMNNPSTQGLTFLYPYDKTVWPRGMLAPLLMWSWAPTGVPAPGDADAIQVSLTTTSGSFSWTGQFGRPAILMTTGGHYIRSPIPQDVWDMATNTAGGPTPSNVPDQLTVSLLVAKDGMQYGPITETWTVAPGNLAGTVYYNSYGTHLVANSIEGSYPNHTGPHFGAAVLGIKAGATAPVVVAGVSSPAAQLGSGVGCRVCHVVSADGSRLIAQHGDVYQTTSAYDLKNANAETVLTGYDNTFGWAGLYIDGSTALTNVAQLAAGQPAASQLFTFPPTSNTPLTTPGIPADLLAGAPAFSPDGNHVAFEFLGGTLSGLAGGATPSVLVSLDFDKATMTFSNLRKLATMPGGGSIGGGGLNAGFPAFFPTNDAVVFHNQISNPGGSHRYNTWNGATAQVWWSDLATGTAANLSTLNGIDGATPYLPTSTSHPDDTVLNYEPTSAPLVSGGYAWVIFTSRRLYGNLATNTPTVSDPRNYDANDYTQITCKKLWVAAVDIGSIKNGKFVQGWTPGSDPSHPAFYLPAQELMAGNARGFWVLDPCLANGMSCQTGDQCCNGYCEPTGDGGALTCGMQSGCAGLTDKCTTSADCCDTTNLCVNGFCSQAQTQ